MNGSNRISMKEESAKEKQKRRKQKKRELNLYLFLVKKTKKRGGWRKRDSDWNRSCTTSPSVTPIFNDQTKDIGCVV